MSLQYAVLGLLAEDAKSGYELVQEFDYARSVIWPAPQNEIYRELAKLLKAGEIAEEEGQGPRGRRRYRILPAGKARLKTWLLSSEVNFTLRYEPILRSVFFSTLNKEEIKQRVIVDLPFYREQLRILQDAENRADSAPEKDLRRFGRHQAIALYQALISWSESALKDMDALAD